MEHHLLSPQSTKINVQFKFRTHPVEWKVSHQGYKNLGLVRWHLPHKPHDLSLIPRTQMKSWMWWLTSAVSELLWQNQDGRQRQENQVEACIGSTAAETTFTNK